MRASRTSSSTLGLTLLKVIAFGAIALVVGPRVMPWLLRQAARTGSRELFTLAVLALSVGIAFGAAKLFGVSFALGAFFAGMVLNESDLSHKAASNSLPLQDAFAVLFFVSVGMLFDPTIIVREPMMLAGVLLLVLIGKSLVALAVVLVLGLSGQHGAGRLGIARAGRRVLVHPRGARHRLRAAAARGLEPHSRGFAGVDHAESARVRRDGPARRVHPRATRAERCDSRRIATRSTRGFRRRWRRARVQAEQKAAAHRTLSPQELVERFPVFAALTPEQREVVLLHMAPYTANPGDRIIRKGEPGGRRVLHLVGRSRGQVRTAAHPPGCRRLRRRDGPAERINRARPTSSRSTTPSS